MYWRLEPARRGMRFSRIEITQILIAVAAMTLAFSLVFLGRIYWLSSVPAVFDLVVIALIFVSSFVAVVTAFLLHELAHKAVAQRYGCFAEFRAYPMGLLLGIFTAAFGFLFAAPGAVMVSGAVSERQNARISAAGPGTNAILAAGFIGLAVLLGVSPDPIENIAAFFVGDIAFVNLFLGGFNLVPFPPLDGSKIFAYDRVMWVAMVVGLVAVGYLGWTLGVVRF
ncbi:MAG TPA: site-2 protease family protein [Thermoplasmata archaeon]|nr:site-2 protease family protein [Thermoplasmata archaeon]